MFDFIVNPTAKNGRGETIISDLERILKEKGAEYRIHKTNAPKHATEIARELCENGAENIVAVGGDGTIHEVLNGLDTAMANFGIIPCGSGNDFIAAAKIPLDIEEAVNVILSCEPKPTDYMVCDGVKGINIIGTGIDVDILKRCKRSKILKGKLQYVISLVISLLKFRFYRFTANANGRSENREALIACVGNGSQFGGGIRMCPGAVIDDGKLDFVVAGKLKKIRIPFAFVKLLKGKILEQDFTTKEMVESVKLDFDEPITIQIDGELYDDLKFDLSVKKGELKLFRP